MFPTGIFQRMKAHEGAAGALHPGSRKNLREMRIMTEQFADAKIGGQKRGCDRIHDDTLMRHPAIHFAPEQTAQQSRLHRKHDLADMRACFHQFMRLPRLRERECFEDHRLGAAAFIKRPNLLPHPVRNGVFEFHRTRPQG